MTKQVVQDILPPKKKGSIRKIPLPERRNNSTPPKPSARNQRGLEQNNQPPKTPRKLRMGKIRWIALVVLIIVILFGMFGFSKAEVEITPRKLSYDIDEIVTAGGEDGTLSFKITTITKEVIREVESTGKEVVERRASGEIIIFNDHSSKPQPLIKNTRFETPEGLIYRINKSITVPGTSKEGGKTVPGQLKVRVYADSPGKDYNIGLTDFTIPGFKSLPQYDNFFARSATEMTGGFIGEVKTINSEVEKTTRNELKEELQNTLRDEAIVQTPENYILLPLSVRINSFSLPTEEKGNVVIITEKGTLSGVILLRSELETFIASKVVSDPTDIRVSNLEVLSYEIKNQPEDQEDSGNLSSFEMNLRGKAMMVWMVPEKDIKESLAGKSKKNLKEMLLPFNSIERAEATLRPFWKRSFPKNPEKIHLKIITESESID